jgi:hypothetical protein
LTLRRVSAAQLDAAFERMRRLCQAVLDQDVAKDAEIKHLRIELAIAHDDIENTIVMIHPPAVKGT